MKVQYIKSACVLIENEGTRVLSDPWLTDGAYYGSWFHYPPLRVGPGDFNDVDYIYISHIHPDHLDIATLKQMNREIPILIHEYQEKFVLRILQSLGFTSVTEVSHRKEFPLAPGFTVEILAADDCRPELCGKSFGCAATTDTRLTGQIDSMALFRGTRTILNANDCLYEMASAVCDYINETTDGVDLALIGYSGAGCYPQCFENYSDAERNQKADAKKRQFLIYAEQYLNHLKPAHFMPFAGQYTLGGSLVRLNPHRGITEIEEVPAAFEKILTRTGLSSRLVLLNSLEWFDVDTGTASAPFVPPDPDARQAYVDAELSSKRYAYQETENGQQPSSPDDLLLTLRKAHERLKKRQERFPGLQTSWTVYLDPGHDRLYSIPMNGGRVEPTARGEEREPFVRIALDATLLDLILHRKAHWNNAEIGSHLTYYRKPDAFVRNVYGALIYLHV